MKAQLSAEMLVLIVVVLAVLGIVATQLLKTAEQGSQKIDEKSQEIFDRAGEQSKGNAGAYCNKDSNCESGICSDNRCF